MVHTNPPQSAAAPKSEGSKEPAYLAQARAWNPSYLPDLKSATLLTALPRLLAHPNIAMKRWRGGPVEHTGKPVATVEPGCDAGVIRVRMENSIRYLALATGGNARFSYLNPRRGAQIALVECLRRLACSGAQPLAMSSRLALADPVKSEETFSLRESIAGLKETAQVFNLPEIGSGMAFIDQPASAGVGAASVVSVMGQVEQEKYLTRQWVRAAGDKLVLLGAAPTELGGSQYQGIIHQLNAGDAPQCDFAEAQKLFYVLHTLIKAGQVRAAHDLAEGGMLCSAVEMLFAPGLALGATLDLATLQCNRLDALLFGESQNRAIVVVGPERLGSVLADSHLRGVSAAVIGEVTANPVLTVRGATNEAVSWPVAELHQGWSASLENKIKVSGPIA